MQKAIQHLRSRRPDWSDIGDPSLAVMDFLTNHLASEDKAYLR